MDDQRRPARALVLPGGPDFHVPGAMAQALVGLLRDSPGPAIACDVVEGLDILADSPALDAYDLIVPLWTEGHLTTQQEHGLVTAIRTGTGLGCVHGATAAFLDSFAFHALVGGHFVDHPGGEVPYRVEVDRSHPVTEGVADFSVRTEQYYLHVDPANRVLATTVFTGDVGPLAAGGPVTMPVAWTRHYGAGRVFYCALGHRPDVLEGPSASRLTSRGLRWAGHAL